MKLLFKHELREEGKMKKLYGVLLLVLFAVSVAAVRPYLIASGGEVTWIKTIDGVEPATVTRASGWIQYMCDTQTGFVHVRGTDPETDERFMVAHYIREPMTLIQDNEAFTEYQGEASIYTWHNQGPYRFERKHGVHIAFVISKEMNSIYFASPYAGVGNVPIVTNNCAGGLH